MRMQGRKAAHPSFQALFLGCITVLASADFQQPSLTIPSRLVAGKQETLRCMVVGTGTNVILSWTVRPGDSNPSTTCTPVPPTEYISCSSVYTFVPDRADDGMRITCSASQAGSSNTRSDTDKLNLILPPPDKYPLIEGPGVVIDNRTETWSCKVEEAKPRVSLSWRIDGGNEIIDGIQEDTQEGNTYNSVNTLTRAMTAPFSNTPRTLTCVMRQDTERKEVVKQIHVTYAPRVTVANTEYSPREGVNVRLACTVEARPDATVQWFKNDNSIDRSSGKYKNGDATNPILEIVKPDKTDSGIYKCAATNDVGQTTSQPITVTVEYKPRVSIPASQYTVNISKLLTIPCVCDAVPATLTSVTWQYIDDADINRPVNTGLGSKYGGGTVDNPSLTIYNVQRSDAGRYTCRCDNTPGFGVSNLTEVKVNFPPTNIKISPSALFPKVGERAELTCTADAEPSARFSWVLKGDTTERGNQSTFVIAAAQRTDKGKYTCIASNMLGSADTEADISVHYKPYLTPESSSVAVDVGTDVTLECNIDANPIAFTVTWLKGSDEVDRSNGRISGGREVSTPNLIISNVQESDAGLYKCTVNNQVGQTTITFDVSISFPPRDATITPSADVINLKEFESQTLTCSGFANPSPEYTWKAGSEIISTEQALVIASAGPEDNRQVTCEVKNSKGVETATTRINVSYKPRGTEVNPTVSAKVGETATLTCAVTANPAATSYKWSFSGEDLEETGSVLQVPDLEDSSFGSYICLASNSLGTSSPIVIKLQKASNLGTGASVSGASLSTPILILIILLIIILIIIIIVVLVICYKKGKLCKKTEKSRIQPAVQPAGEVTPRAEDKPVADSHGGLRSPQWSVSTTSVVSRQHVSLEPDTDHRDKPQRLSFEDEVRPNGALINGSIAGGTTISLPGDTPRPHHLPSLDRPPGEEKPRKKKKRRKRKDLENVEEQGE